MLKQRWQSLLLMFVVMEGWLIDNVVVYVADFLRNCSLAVL
jgi:hypothetical protein